MDLADAATVTRELVAQADREARAQALDRLKIGSHSVWELIRNGVAEDLYDSLWTEREKRRGVLARLRGALWAAQFDRETLHRILAGPLAPAGRGIEGLLWRRRIQPAAIERADVVLAGDVTFGSGWIFREALAHLECAGLRTLILAHYDHAGRLAAAYDEHGLHHVAADRWLTPSAAVDADRLWSAMQAALELPQPDGAQRAEMPHLAPGRLRPLPRRAAAVGAYLDLHRPSLVVVPDERDPLARFIALEAARREIPCVGAPSVNSQLLWRVPPLAGLASQETWVVGEFVASYCARYGAQGYRVVGREGVGEELDRAAERREGRRTLGVGSSERLVLFISQAFPQNQILIRRLQAAVSRVAGGVLVVRPHPKENLTMKRLLAPSVSMAREPSARQALLAADVVVTVSSLMGLDASLMGCRVLLTSTDGVPTMPALVAAGMASFVPSQELETNLYSLLEADHEPPGPDAIVADNPRRIADRLLALLDTGRGRPAESPVARQKRSSS